MYIVKRGDKVKRVFLLEGLESTHLPGKESLRRRIGRYGKDELWVFCKDMQSPVLIALRRLLRGMIPCYRVVDLAGESDFASAGAYAKVSDFILERVQAKRYIHISADGDSVTLARRHAAVRRRERGAERKRLAYFSPFEPARSGIATYSAELLPYLAKHYEITLVADNDNMDACREYAGVSFGLISYEEFRKRASEFDRILYHMGNSHYHIYIYRAILEYPGICVLHDFYLSGLVKYREFKLQERRFWAAKLFQSHGYIPLANYFDKKNYEELSFAYPVNMEVLQSSLGIVTHSEYARSLTREWYLSEPSPPWRVIPHMRESEERCEKEAAKRELGLREDEIVICSFGHINKTKLSHRVLDAFIASSLHENRNVRLIFVGNRSDPHYCRELEKRASEYGVSQRVEITGWMEMDRFRLYLQAADIAVQLRTLSRGETSGTVLDALNHEAAVVVNANGSMAELPADILWKLDDDFGDSQLIEALETLSADEERRRELAAKGKSYLRKMHDPAYCASLYADAIEEFYSPVESLCGSIAPQREELQPLLDRLWISAPRQRQILVDVSTLVDEDLRTGVQRVVRAQLLQLMRVVPESVRVEPVYLSFDGAAHYRYASDYCCRILGMPVGMEDRRVEIETGDIFYGVDLYRSGVIEAARAGIYEKWRARGVLVSFTIHDLLPIDFPHFFPEGTREEHIEWLKVISENADLLVATSKTGAEITRRWIDELFDIPSEALPLIESVYLGADIAASAPLHESGEDESVLSKMRERPTFLMVGTVEPRKGHLQALEAFGKLWREGHEVALLVVGKEGWIGLPDEARRNIPRTVKAMREAREREPLFDWLESVDDTLLQRLYESSTALLFPSEDEGFGIPLIEAAHHSLPILVRDRPIFRELAAEHAAYFEDTLSSEKLAHEILKWLEAYERGEHPRSEAMPWISWRESARRLYELFAKVCEID